jgi:hypothetical protein
MSNPITKTPVTLFGSTRDDTGIIKDFSPKFAVVVDADVDAEAHETPQDAFALTDAPVTPEPVAATTSDPVEPIEPTTTEPTSVASKP